ncbi:Urea transporter [Aquiflexum balticum DSM 16537]|uniref:Urea transporter n=1 Tax=Aquiflexum balticum DSM 16537 TaxID=758820 RepID=A0A1W2HBP2_9BACT|nr:urea transporter [Aquiflexum balticum]SMD46026.1 Urea transporter [Aquiflexum balticum DSM 16537]
MKKLAWFPEALFNSYAQVFFSNNKWFGIILLLLTFVDFYVGIFGLISVTTALFTGYFIGLYENNIRQGYYGFNSLLVGVGLSIYFQPSPLLLVLVIISGMLTVFLSLAFEGILGKYGLPFLSLPFILVFWILRLATREFESLGLSERGVYVLNELYLLGGRNLVTMYEWWNQIPFHTSLKTYFLSIGAIFFQQNVFSGFFAALGLLIYSRIGFTLSLLGFYIAYLFYILLGVPFSEVSYSYIGFNYILTAIALGGYFIIPNRSTYLSLLFIIPITAVIGISLQQVFNLFYLPVHSFPFNVTVLLFLYGLKFRVDNRIGLSTIFWQQQSPEKNLYNFLTFQERFGKGSPLPIYLPFFGEWTVTQGHNGTFTHKDDWRHAWDFEIQDEQGKTYQDEGDFLTDYYCFDKNVLAPADGEVETLVNDIEDNSIGKRNLDKNWGNTIVIKHSEFLFSKLSHLKKGSILPKIGDKVFKGEIIAKAGNSGNSAYPHLHFQLQATPFIGSKTIDYPLSDFWMKYEEKETLEAVGNPPMLAKVSTLTPNPQLKKAFSFVIGNQIQWETNKGEKVIWEVKRDYLLNTYLECKATDSRAFYKLDEGTLHLIHFVGNRKSLLYQFYLAAYKISFGYSNKLQLRDSFPVNMVFNPNRIFFQDIIAPFYRFLKGEYLLSYPDKARGLGQQNIVLNGKAIKSAFGKEIEHSEFLFQIGANGLQNFQFKNKNLQTQAKCTGS